jgi:crotonobetainyl-CoA:carnitine CoA-transferase CaiB-like acyl-CoA transferase
MTTPALHGIRVLELGHAISAPHCTQILADHGADVIRIEPPGGDRTRGALPVVDGDSLYFAAHNRSKRSVVIDLKAPRGREVFMQLADTADVVVTNYSSGVPGRLGIGYDSLSERNPRLIFVHITGFGSRGPARDYGAYDGIIQAMSGVPSLTGAPGGPPALAGAFVADHLAAMQAAVGALLALARRGTTGQGGYVEISMLDGYLSTLAHHVGSALDLGLVPAADGNKVPTAFANTFPASDGFVYLAPLGPAAWQAFCKVIEAPQWLADSDPRWRIEDGRGEVEQVVREWTAGRTRGEIVDELRAAAVPCGPVNDVAEAVSDPVHLGRDPIMNVLMPSGRRLHVPSPEIRLDDPASGRPPAVPEAGQHTAEVLAKLGYDQAELEALAASGVIGQARDGPRP